MTDLADPGSLRRIADQAETMFEDRSGVGLTARLRACADRVEALTTEVEQLRTELSSRPARCWMLSEAGESDCFEEATDD